MRYIPELIQHLANAMHWIIQNQIVDHATNGDIFDTLESVDWSYTARHLLGVKFEMLATF